MKFASVLTLSCSLFFGYCTSSKRLQSALPSSEAVVDSLRVQLPALMKEAGIPGLAVGLIENGKLIWTGSFGVANVKTGMPISDSTVFEAASLGKPVFGYAVLMLADKGLIDLHKPLVQYLPSTVSFSDPRIYKITPQMVLMHKTGLPNWRRSDTLKTYFEPGERFSYSGEGVDLLQKAVEEILKKPLDQIMQELVFAPFQMNSSSYTWKPSFERLKAYPHNEAGETVGRSQPQRASAASSLHTTVSDYGKFLSAALRGEGLKEETFRQMTAYQSQIDEGCVNCLEPRKTPRISKSIFWGLGWGIQQTQKGPALWHWGDNGAFKAYAVGLLNEKDGLVFFANSSNGLSITEAISQMALSTSQPSVKWLTYEPYNTPSRKLLSNILGDKAVAIQRLKEDAPKNMLTAKEYNWVAQQLFNRKMYVEAIALFEVSLQTEPSQFSALVGTAQAYEKLKDKTSALRYYKQAESIRPEDKEVAEVIVRLQKPDVKVEEKTLQQYLGTYHSPLGKLIVTLEGGTLQVTLEGQSKEELIPQSPTKFYAPGIKADVTFSNGEMLIEAGGQKITAKK